MRSFIKGSLHLGIVAAVCFLTTSCSTQPEALDTSEPQAIQKLAFKGISLMEKKHYEQARKVFAEGLRNDPTSCSLNTLNALSYQMQGRENNLALLGKAVAGYKIASKFCPNDPWPYYYTGLASLQTKRYLAADKNFKQAAELLKGNADKHTLTLLYRAYLLSAYRSGQVSDGKAALQEYISFASTGILDVGEELERELKQTIDELKGKIIHTKEVVEVQDVEFEDV